MPEVSPAERAALCLHFVGGLPGAGDHFADPAHRLRVGADDADRPQVVKDVFGGDRFAANPAFREGDILGQVRVEMMADHQHVEMLVERVDGVGTRRIGGTGQHVGFAADAEDIRVRVRRRRLRSDKCGSCGL